MYLKQTIEKYNNYKIEGERTTTTYRIYIAWDVEEDGKERLEEKDLYEAIYKIGEENEKIEEKKGDLSPRNYRRKILYFPCSYCLYFSRRTNRPKRRGNNRRISNSQIVEILRMYDMSRKSPECVICRM